MSPEAERKLVGDSNSEKARPLTSRQVVQEIEKHYTEAGTRSLKFITFSHLTDYSVAERAVLGNLGSTAEDPVLKGQLEDRYVEAINIIKTNFENPDYKERFLEADSFSKKLHRAYIAEGSSDSESLDKIADQFKKTRDRLQNTRSQL
jgi:hypothetical protein